jgi:hypothetical protein
MSFSSFQKPWFMLIPVEWFLFSTGAYMLVALSYFRHLLKIILDVTTIVNKQVYCPHEHHGKACQAPQYYHYSSKQRQ